MRSIALGIDTGGTYTDAVLIEQNSGRVLTAAKALTTQRDLSIGIRRAIEQVLSPTTARAPGESINPTEITLVGLSSTLATNALVEGQGSPVCLLLIGYDPALIEQHGFQQDLVTPYVVYLRGGHDGEGKEREPLDEDAVRQAILTYRDQVAAFAVSSYFGVRNAEHELRVKALIEELTAQAGSMPLPVTCGHELTTRLNSIRRATTVALNARLIPILRSLIITVRETLDALGIGAPLMIVKGDGSLVRSEWAIHRPIETILSGPAASVVGAWHIAGRRDMWVVDVGGTTTDIAILRAGLPHLNAEGARVGGWRTMVEAADVHTVGLGGDSYVRFSTNGAPAHRKIVIGPQRVLPLCRLATECPEVREELRQQKHIRQGWLKPLLGQFLVLRRPTAGLSEVDQALVDALSAGPISVVAIAQQKRFRAFLAERIERLIAQQVILRAGFTPTDALHVLERFQAWDVEAARLGAELLAAQLEDITPESLCQQVVATMSDRVAQELVTKVLQDEIAPPDWDSDAVAAGLLDRALNAITETELACQLTLKQPVIAVGAPVEAYLPRAADQLHTELIIPHDAGVANAIGAVVGSVVQRARILIRPIDFEERYRLHLPGHIPAPEGVRDFDTLEEAVAYATALVPDSLAQLAQEAGAQQVQVEMKRTDHMGSLRGKSDQKIFLETVLEFTAIGRPAVDSRWERNRRQLVQERHNDGQPTAA